MPDYIAGGAGNAALISFASSLGQEGIRHGVRVLAVCPGPIATERMINLRRAWALKELGDADRYQELPPRERLGRPGTPEEVADLVVYLASDRASYMSGIAIDIG